MAPTKHSVVVVAAVAAALGIISSASTPQDVAAKTRSGKLAEVVPFAELWDADRQFDDGDDQSNYANHPLLRARQNIVPKLNTIVRASWFHEPVIGVWEPITTMAKMLLVDAFGLHACVFVRASLCLHALNMLLAGVLALGLIAYLLPETTNPIPHVVAAVLLIGIHPLRVETLAWASCFPFHIAMLFSLLAALCQLEHYQRRRYASPLGPWRLASAACFAIACLSKPAALGVAPFLLLLDAILVDAEKFKWLIDEEPKDAPPPPPGREGVPFVAKHKLSGKAAAELASRSRRLLASLLFDALPLLFVAAVCAVWAASASSGVAEWYKLWRWHHRILRACHSVWLYAFQQVLPVRLCVLYGMPVDWVALDNWQFGGALVATLTASYDLVKSARNDGLTGRRRLLVALAYVALLSPTLGLVGGHIAEISADRYAHLPSMLLGVPLLAACLVQLRPRPRLADAAVLVALLAVEASITSGYVSHWRTPHATIKESVRVAPRYYRSRYILGTQHEQQGRLQEAEKQYRVSRLLFPGFVNGHFALTQVLANQGKLKEATEAMRDGTRVAPDAYFAHINLGDLLKAGGRLKEAEVSLNRAIKLAPTERDPYLSLADVLKGRAAELQARNDRAADERAAAAITSGDKIA